MGLALRKATDHLLPRRVRPGCLDCPFPQHLRTIGHLRGRKEKAPAALWRKVSEAPDGSENAIWGDGEQTRSFCYVDDYVDGLVQLMDSGYTKPINLGTHELVTVNQLVDMVCVASGKTLSRKHDLPKPQGVRGRNIDNRLLRTFLNGEPSTSLATGIQSTYQWIWGELSRQKQADPPTRKATVRSS